MQKYQAATARNAPYPSPQQRTRIRDAIHWQIALEILSRSNARREALLRLSIGLPPVPRPIFAGRC